MNDAASTQWRTIWISDTHLGTAGCNAPHLLDFLRRNDAETLYLVGDIIDGWQLRRNWVWPRSHNDVVQKILRKARKGTKVIFIPGNHDEFARQFAGYAFGDIAVQNEAVHITADGRRLWVTHGDQFDGVIQHSKWLARLGDGMYTAALWLNQHFNRVRHRMGLHYWSLSQYLKHKVKNAVSFITDFENALVAEARRRGFDGVVCGHIHQAEMRLVDGILYCNDGDWVESLTALAEDHRGELHLIKWADQRHMPTVAPARRSRPIELPALPSVLRRPRAVVVRQEEPESETAES
jgi:UDP-2,3-diacylglucosamine pyrophosphatase LpxH